MTECYMMCATWDGSGSKYYRFLLVIFMPVFGMCSRTYRAQLHMRVAKA